MDGDRLKWNAKHLSRIGPQSPSAIVTKFIPSVPPGKALDIAAGRGRNALYLARKGFEVDAVDISDQGLRSLTGKNPAVHPICADLDQFDIAENRYQLIISIRYLNRRLFPQMIRGLRTGGTLIFETFLENGLQDDQHPCCRDHFFRANELLHAFLSLNIRYYEEHLSHRARRPAMVASLVAMKGSHRARQAVRNRHY